MVPFIGELFLETRTKLHKTLKRTVGCCKINIVFKSKINFSNVFRFIDCLPYDLVSHVVYKLHCGRCNSSYYGETDRHLKVRSGEHVTISPLNLNKIKPAIGSSMQDHLLFRDHSPTFDYLIILAHRTNKFLLEKKRAY